MLTRTGLPAKIPCHTYTLWLVSCSFLLSRQLLSNIVCLCSSMKLGRVVDVIPLYLNLDSKRIMPHYNLEKKPSKIWPPFKNLSRISTLKNNKIHFIFRSWFIGSHRWGQQWECVKVMCQSQAFIWTQRRHCFSWYNIQIKEDNVPFGAAKYSHFEP